MKASLTKPATRRFSLCIWKRKAWIISWY